MYGRITLFVLIVALSLFLNGCKSTAKASPESKSDTIIIDNFEVDDIIVGWFNYTIITIMDSDSNYYAIVSEQNHKCKESPDKQILLEPGFRYNIPIKLKLFTDNDKLFSSAIKSKGDRLLISNPSITFYANGTTSKDIYYIENLCDEYLILGKYIR